LVVLVESCQARRRERERLKGREENEYKNGEEVWKMSNKRQRKNVDCRDDQSKKRLFEFVPTPRICVGEVV
jgi:hypothetical protein